MTLSRGCQMNSWNRSIILTQLLSHRSSWKISRCHSIQILLFLNVHLFFFVDYSTNCFIYFFRGSAKSRVNQSKIDTVKIFIFLPNRNTSVISIPELILWVLLNVIHSGKLWSNKHQIDMFAKWQNWFDLFCFVSGTHLFFSFELFIPLTNNLNHSTEQLNLLSNM